MAGEREREREQNVTEYEYEVTHRNPFGAFGRIYTLVKISLLTSHPLHFAISDSMQRFCYRETNQRIGTRVVCYSQSRRSVKKKHTGVRVYTVIKIFLLIGKFQRFLAGILIRHLRKSFLHHVARRENIGEMRLTPSRELSS